MYEDTDACMVLRAVESDDEGLYCDGSKEVCIKSKAERDKI